MENEIFKKIRGDIKMTDERLHEIQEELFEEIPPEEEKWVIDDVNKLDWAIGKVKEEQERFDYFKAAAEHSILELKYKIAEEEKKLNARTSYLKELMGDFMDTLPTKKTKTQESFTLPNGKLVRKFSKYEYVSKSGEDIKHDPEIIKYCENTDKELLKVETSVKWADLKKRLANTEDGDVIDSVTGEVLDCIVLNPVPETIKVE